MTEINMDHPSDILNTSSLIKTHKTADWIRKKHLILLLTRNTPQHQDWRLLQNKCGSLRKVFHRLGVDHMISGAVDSIWRRQKTLGGKHKLKKIFHRWQEVGSGSLQLCPMFCSLCRSSCCGVPLALLLYRYGTISLYKLFLL